YDMPNTADAYTHRIGRTGRAAKTGDAYTLISEEDAAMVRSIERALGKKVERRIVKDFDYSQPGPARDNEFARPPREPRGRRPQGPRTQAPQPRSNGRLLMPVSPQAAQSRQDRPAPGTPQANTSSRRHRRSRSRSRATA
ncbi:MAG TPA: ATP-dependent helicase, partial [Chloroflexia bacterium]|nr:ATP-dependent helicase [Chloroflexia bacterium]